MSSLPLQPGVYSFVDANGKILYVGKAKNLKNRVTSYTRVNQLIPRIKKLVTTAVELRYEVLDSELEALLIEAELIRAHQPPFNILLKDDKSPLYVVITKDPIPQIMKKRKQQVQRFHKKDIVLGPFPSSYKLTEVLGIARKIFPWCSLSPTQREKLTKPCFYFHLDLCPGVCFGEVSVEEYQQTIANLIQFLRGKKTEVISELKSRMQEASDNQEFEKAASLRDKLQLIKDVTSSQYKLTPELVLPSFSLSAAEDGLVHLTKLLSTYLSVPKEYQLHRIEGYDVSNIQGTNASVSMVVFSEGRPDKQEYRLFNIRSLQTPNDYHMLKEAIVRRQNHPEWGQPSLLVIDGGKGQLRSALSVWNWSVPIVSLAKDPDRLIIPLLSPEKKIDGYEIIRLPSTHPSLKLLQQIRDESHRFAKKQHTRLRTKQMFK